MYFVCGLRVFLCDLNFPRDLLSFFDIGGGETRENIRVWHENMQNCVCWHV